MTTPNNDNIEATAEETFADYFGEDADRALERKLKDLGVHPDSPKQARGTAPTDDIFIGVPNRAEYEIEQHERAEVLHRAARETGEREDAILNAIVDKDWSAVEKLSGRPCRHGNRGP